MMDVKQNWKPMLLLGSIIIGGGGLDFYLAKLYGDVQYKNGCIWFMIESGHADRVGECPIYPAALPSTPD